MTPSYNYPPAEKISSPAELRRLYDKLRGEVVDYEKTATVANAGASMAAKDRNKYKQEATAASKQVLTLTKSQKHSDEANKSTMWSGGAAISVTILYETWKIVGFPGGYEWMKWWNHEAVFGVMMWTATIFFAQIYKAYAGWPRAS
tara:strand:+ start:11899 stop:12336 length:438 start_codon:yes stop_codon:yes gene_type:complete